MPRCYVGFVRVFALVCGVCMCLREVPYRFLMYPYVPYSVHRSFLNHPIRPIPLCVQRSFRHLGLGHKILETRTLWWTMWRCDDVTCVTMCPNQGLCQTGPSNTAVAMSKFNGSVICLKSDPKWSKCDLQNVSVCLGLAVLSPSVFCSRWWLDVTSDYQTFKTSHWGHLHVMVWTLRSSYGHLPHRSFSHTGAAILPTVGFIA
jgi:hypothetical protein